MAISIRNLHDGDLAFASTVLDAAFGAVDGHYLPNLRRFFAWQPDGMFVATEHGSVIGMVGAFDYAAFASIGLMVVQPAFQGRGIGRELMNHVLTWVDKRDIPMSILDATEAGAPLYRKLGFVDTGTTHTVYRCEGDCLPVAAVAHVQTMTPAHLESVVALDAQVFGAARRHMLSGLLAEFPNNAFVLPASDGHIAGFIFVGRNLGPFAARDPLSARTLLAAALRHLHQERRTASVILPDANRLAVDLYDAHGFLPFRSCRFMVRGSTALPGDVLGNYGILSYATG
ncbi:MAG: GNAT family N-acetyltransferase [Chloroflexota bacterium]|nr:GNAT family N-acetyltransferase [Chloroflexota bacterium]